MKLGILSLPLYINYGGIMQAYALQTALERMGHQVTVFDTSFYPKQPPLLLQPYFFVRTLAAKTLGRHFGPVLMKNHRKHIDLSQKHIQRFILQYIHRVVLRNLSDANKLDLDGIVVGSDQVWRPHYFRCNWGTTMEDAFVAFAHSKNILKLAYSASFGTDEWEFSPEETANCRKLIREFTAVSVREMSGVEMCRKYLDYSDAIQTLDPTMLLSREDYTHLFEAAETEKSPGALYYYFLDENADKLSLVKKIAGEKHLIPFSTKFCCANQAEQPKVRVISPVENWLRSFNDAEMVVTDSFHGCVFSIIFNKPFIVIGNEKRGMSRFETLLSIFGLEKCLLSSTEDYRSEAADFDWTQISATLEAIKKDCRKFLAENLEQNF